jgi:hypothetical protein
MNRDRDFDQTLTHWLEDGADQAPERFIWAALDDVERTAQRGAWSSLEGFLMKLKTAAPYLGVAAVILLAIAAYQVFGGANVGTSEPSPRSTASSSPSASGTPRLLTSADLPNIVLTDANAPDGFTVDGTEVNAAALAEPLREGGPYYDDRAFVEALMTKLNSTETGGYVSWSALFETPTAAEAAFDYLVTEHGSADGWGMERSSVDPGLGDESVTFSGPAYDNFETNIVHIWRVGNLVVAVAALGDVAVGDANADQLVVLARLMDDRAH